MRSMWRSRGAPSCRIVRQMSFSSSTYRSRHSRRTVGATTESPSIQRSATSDALPLRPLPRVLEGVVDDPMLANPLERHKRLSTDWMGVIMELEGGVIADTVEAHSNAWLKLAHEEGLKPPFQWQLKRAVAMKAEQAISECLCWTRNPQEVRRLAERKERIYAQAIANSPPRELRGARRLLQTLRANGVPVVLASVSPEARVRATLDYLGLPADGDDALFSAVVCAEDVQRARPDPEMYLYSCQELGRPPLRTVVISSNNMGVEAAHEIGMQCVCVAGTHPVYELTAADLVVSSLEDVSFINLKSLFRNEKGRQPLELELMPEEEEEEADSPATTTMTLDDAGW